MKTGFSLCIFIVMAFFSCIPSAPAKLQYIVYAAPDGPLGDDLNAYWEDVYYSKNPCVTCFAITQYPPHISVTGFFFPNPSRSASDYINLINMAIAHTDESYTRAIAVSPKKFNRGYSWDYLSIKSDYLDAFADYFVTLEPKASAKGPDFHITLRDEVLKPQNKITKIQQMQSDLINPKHGAGWLIFLYQKENNEVSLVKVDGNPIRLIPIP